MVKKKEKKEELFFVELRDPEEVKKSILLVLKDILEALKRFEKFRETRHKKLDKIQKLRILVKEANKMLGSLKSKLPQTSLKAAFQAEPPARLISNNDKAGNNKKKKNTDSDEPQQKAKQAPKKEMTELERLEFELNAIENKLKSF